MRPGRPWQAGGGFSLRLAIILAVLVPIAAALAPAAPPGTLRSLDLVVADLEPPAFFSLPSAPTPLSPDDTYLASQYGWPQIRLGDAWGTIRPVDDVVVCVLDTGIRETHQELVGGRLVATADFIEDPTAADGQHYHGTFTTSLAAGNRDNGAGIAGVSDGGFAHGRMLNETGWGRNEEAALAVRWCDALPYERVIVSASWGGPPEPGDPILMSAINDTAANGRLLVFSAGNENSARPPCFDCVLTPASWPNTIAVASTSPGEVPSWWSSWGPEVDIAAPGDIILGAANGADDEYTLFSGTSFSAPLLAGVLAMLWSEEPDLTAQQIEARLYATAQDVGPPGKDIFTGHGELDARCLLENIVPCDGRS